MHPHSPPLAHDRERRPPRRRSPPPHDLAPSARDGAPPAPPPPPPAPEPISVSLASGHEDRRIRASDSGTDAAYLSPWTGVGSPASSDFEAVASDSDFVMAAAPGSRPSNAPVPAAANPSNLARSLSRRQTARVGDSRASGSATSTFGSSGGGDGRAPEATSSSSMERSDDDLRRGIEGDDEDSSAFEDGEREEGRGRARTRRNRDPELKRSMLEDALRSSLVTLLSLAPAQAGMSQSPAMSHVSLAALFQSHPISATGPTNASSGRVPAATVGTDRTSRAAQRPSPFASALGGPLDEEEEEVAEREDEAEAGSSSVFEDVFASSSSSSGDEEATQLAQNNRSRAIPISRSRTRAYSDSVPSASDAYDTADFSPLVASRPLGMAPGQPSSNSPPYYSRSRRGAAPVRRRGGRGRGGSTSPGPASLEERRRARAAAATGASSGAPVVASEGEGEEQRDEAFQELVDAARFFSDLSPRSSLRAPYPSLPSSYETARPRTITTTTASSWAPATTASASATSTPPFYSDEDPALASESPPMLEGLSSGAEGESDRSPIPGSLPFEEKRGGGEAGEKGGREVGEPGDAARGAQQKKQGWFSWLKGLSATVEIKVWHLVGICGVLIGVGIGASSLVHTLAPASWLAARLDFAHHASPFLAPSQPSTVGSWTPPERPGGSSQAQQERMSSLFL